MVTLLGPPTMAVPKVSGSNRMCQLTPGPRKKLPPLGWLIAFPFLFGPQSSFLKAFLSMTLLGFAIPRNVGVSRGAPSARTSASNMPAKVFLDT